MVALLAPSKSTPLPPFPSGLAPVTSVPMKLSCTVVAVFAGPSISTPFAVLPEMRFRAIRWSRPGGAGSAFRIRMPSLAFPMTSVPEGPVPMKLPCTLLATAIAPAMSMPSPPLAEMTLPPPTLLPPTPAPGRRRWRRRRRSCRLRQAGRVEADVVALDLGVARVLAGDVDAVAEIGRNHVARDPRRAADGIVGSVVDGNAHPVAQGSSPLDVVPM